MNIELSPDNKLALIARKHVWESYCRTLTLNTGQVEVTELRQIWETRFEPVTRKKWDAGCSSCIVDCIRTMYNYLADLEQSQTKSQPNQEPTKPSKRSSKK